jgi:ribonucleoside-diphosphate reductase alpha chain
MINCYVDGFIGEDQDSMESILDTLRRQALILKSEGGYGFCSDVMRPRGAFIRGIGNESPGAVKMLDMWDTQSSVITAGSGNKNTHKNGKGKIRKGAQMVTMSCFSDTTEVLTDKGWLDVVEIVNRVKVGEELYAIVKNGDKKKIYNPIVREPEPIYEIETIDGEIIKVTADHEFEVCNIKTNEIYLKKIRDVDPDVEYLTIVEVI